jgi:hypothetical protein
MAKIKILLAATLAIGAVTAGSAHAHGYRVGPGVSAYPYGPPGYAELAVPYAYYDREYRRAEKRAKREYRRYLKREAKAYKKLRRAYERSEFRYGYPHLVAPGRYAYRY